MGNEIWVNMVKSENMGYGIMGKFWKSENMDNGIMSKFLTI